MKLKVIELSHRVAEHIAFGFHRFGPRFIDDESSENGWEVFIDRAAFVFSKSVGRSNAIPQLVPQSLARYPGSARNRVLHYKPVFTENYALSASSWNPVKRGNGAQERTRTSTDCSTDT
jgi:hypothetical protein